MSFWILIDVAKLAHKMARTPFISGRFAQLPERCS
jgi:hypothetical protein